jgi:hypothetical protein
VTALTRMAKPPNAEATEFAALVFQRRARPVLWWASLGAVAVLVQGYVYGAWMLSSDFVATPTGRDPVPHDVKVKAWILQVVFSAAAVAATAWVVRGCWRQRRITVDAMIYLGWAAVIWIDPAANLVRPQMMFNSYYFNRGSWVEHIPGWIGRNGHLLPDPLFIETATFLFMVIITVAGSEFMRQLTRRRPGMGLVGLVACTWLVMGLFVFVIEELVVIRGGWVWWTGTIDALTPWAGTQNAIPTTEILLWGGTITAFVTLRYFSYERGILLVDGGLSRVEGPGWLRRGVLTFAVVGYATVAMGGYSVVSASLALYDGTTPDHIPSYFRNGICGPGTAYVCPTPKVPVLLPKTPTGADNVEKP